jgi:hypothetical protein
MEENLYGMMKQYVETSIKDCCSCNYSQQQTRMPMHTNVMPTFFSNAIIKQCFIDEVEAIHVVSLSSIGDCNKVRGYQLRSLFMMSSSAPWRRYLYRRQRYGTVCALWSMEDFKKRGRSNLDGA